MSDSQPPSGVDATPRHDHAWRRVPGERGGFEEYACDLCELTYLVSGLVRRSLPGSDRYQ